MDAPVNLNIWGHNHSVKDMNSWITYSSDLSWNFTRNQPHFLDKKDNRRIVDECATDSPEKHSSGFSEFLLLQDQLS